MTTKKSKKKSKKTAKKNPKKSKILKGCKDKVILSETPETPDSANYHFLIVNGGGGGDEFQPTPLEYRAVFPEPEPAKTKSWWKFW